MKRRHTLGVAIIGSALACAVPVALHAQDLNRPDRRALSQDFARCITGKRVLKELAIRFLLSGEARDGRRVANDKCFAEVSTKYQARGTLAAKWTAHAFRSLIADGLVSTDFAANGPTDLSGALPLSYDLEGLEFKDMPLTEEQQRVTLMLARLGECAARRDPEGVRVAAQTQVNSPEELAALTALAPSFGNCMPAGVSLNFPTRLLRENAVLAYARLAYSLQAGRAGEAAE